jgi:hypothetical protein
MRHESCIAFLSNHFSQDNLRTRKWLAVSKISQDANSPGRTVERPYIHMLHKRGKMATHTPASAGEPRWVKSSLSFANGDCVEVASLPGGQIGVRDSKDTAGPVLRFTSAEWRAFIGGARNGEFDQLAVTN